MQNPDQHPRQLPEWADPGVPADVLDAQGLSRRGLLQRAGLFGAGFLGASALGGAAPALAADTKVSAGDRDVPPPTYAYLVGDHHVHTVYSNDAKYTLSQQAMRAAQFGLDWMAYTEHSHVGHRDIGAELERAEIATARAENPRMLIFQGLEWYIPAAEHATVLVAPGANEASVLREFERRWDGRLNNWTEGAAGNPATADNEAKAVEAVRWLAEQKRAGVIDDALLLANHPARLGIDSPHELRNWRDADPSLFVGMEGAPGAQGAALPGWRGSNSVRGEYENSPTSQSWAGYPAAAYVTYGGFDWMTATVGGMWDAMLAEGKLFSITSNSDSHRTVFDTWANGSYPAGKTFESTGKLPDPVQTSSPQPGSDFWPGQFSRTHVGVSGYGYRQVMDGLRAGRVWVDHGQLIDGLDVWAVSDRQDLEPVTLGGRLRVRRGDRMSLYVTVTTASRPNFHGVLPQLAHVDVIRGAVTGPAADRDSWRAPDTRVVERVDVTGRTGTYTLRVQLRKLESSFYLRLRGSDGRRHGVGLLGADIDPAGPLAGVRGDDDPWLDTWFYSNPIFVDVG
ncbi:histidinol-phosphatase [Motilibacter aurantiacus]|uniref:histidinol-phosphatase n=1 Tax=Motilibacter aurantiacus TaxID=2714955 RepID=UPI0014094233|nr:histidinol-phosphatase [Motilibacter aurantiacus]NHC45453.1 histidinol-phosphatase [Motilibacter aurantiacus]